MPTVEVKTENGTEVRDRQTGVLVNAENTVQPSPTSSDSGGGYTVDIKSMPSSVSTGEKFTVNVKGCAIVEDPPTVDYKATATYLGPTGPLGFFTLNMLGGDSKTLKEDRWGLIGKMCITSASDVTDVTLDKAGKWKIKITIGKASDSQEIKVTRV